MMLTWEKVRDLGADCMTDNEFETLAEAEANPDMIIVRGPVMTFAFGRAEVEAARSEIDDLLDELPDAFHEGRGEGWSFLNLCEDRDGRQWTDQHRYAELLVVLGLAIGRVDYILPRDMWHISPGGMPYIKIRKRTTAKWWE